jgi:hypothetical protein
LSLVASTAPNRPHPSRGAWRDEDRPQDAEYPQQKTEYEELAEAELFSMRDGTGNGATPNQDNHQSR